MRQDPDTNKFFWISGNTDLKRVFTIQALQRLEVLAMEKETLDKINYEFPTIFAELFSNSKTRLKRALKQKEKITKIVDNKQHGMGLFVNRFNQQANKKDNNLQMITNRFTHNNQFE